MTTIKIKKFINFIRTQITGRWQKNTIVYYPRFDSRTDLTNHFYRASWYLPEVEGKCEKVWLFSNKKCVSSGMVRPAAMGQEFKDGAHIEINSNYFLFVKALFTSKLILTWKSPPSLFFKLWSVLLVAPIVNVDTQDVQSFEYGQYCGLVWRHMLHCEEKSLEISKSYEKFTQIYTKIVGQGIKASCVFGTGPSIERSFEYDFSGCFNVTCNTIVKDKDLLDHIKPHFICAGDVVSHFGVSLYAEKFRQQLLEVLREQDIYFLTTATFGYLFQTHYPDVSEKVIIVEQKDHAPNFDLKNNFSLPILASTFNIHMLPLASTFSDNIFIIGCDGKDQDQGKNEDFWAHSRKAQYHDLVETGHICHPTFDLHRQENMYKDYVDSVTTSITQGEKVGKRYFSLCPSHVRPLKERAVERVFGGAFSKTIGSNALTPVDKNTLK